MRCPYCSSDNTQVKDSRPVEDNTAIRRRRTCPVCEQRFTTFERVQLQEVVVIKSDGSRQSFNRGKLRHSIMIALRKRPFDEKKLDDQLSLLVRQLEMSGESEVTSKDIGKRVMEMLSRMDPVGFVRYASVYNDFQQPSDFTRILRSLGGVTDADKDKD